MTTPKLQMPELVVGQAGKELTHNQALAVLDQLSQAVVVDKDLSTPPGSPANGSMYIVAAGATGAWAGQSGKLAYWLTTVAAWTFITPADGWSVWVADEAVRYERKDGAWVEQTGGGTVMSNPMTTAGDLIVGGASGAAERLSKGTDGQVLKMVAGIPAWGADSGGGGGVAFAQVITEPTTARTLGLADAGAYLRHTNASASTVTVAPQSSVTWVADTEVHVRRAAAGNLTLTPGSGVTLNAPSGGTLVMTNAMSVTLKRVAADIWDVIGQTASGGSVTPPSVGAYWTGQGGYYAGLITYADSRQFHLVVADIAADVLGKAWGMSAYNGPLIGANSLDDGVFNQGQAISAGLDVGDYPKEAFKHCVNYSADGKDGFYMAAQNEMILIRDALRPTKPGQVALFATGGAQAFNNAVLYWFSNESSATGAPGMRFDDAFVYSVAKTDTTIRTRPVRRIPA